MGQDRVSDGPGSPVDRGMNGWGQSQPFPTLLIALQGLTGKLGSPEDWPEALNSYWILTMGIKVPLPPGDLFLFGLGLLFPGGYFQIGRSHSHSLPEELGGRPG